jgi:hypothetical protein
MILMYGYDFGSKRKWGKRENKKRKEDDVVVVLVVSRFLPHHLQHVL